MKAIVYILDTSVYKYIQRTTYFAFPEDGYLHRIHRENSRSWKSIYILLIHLQILFIFF